MAARTRFDWLRKVVGEGAALPAVMGPDIGDAWEQVCTAVGIDENELTARVGMHFGTDTIGLLQPVPSTVQLVPETMAREYLMIPVKENGSEVVIAIADPTDPEAIQQASFTSGRTVSILIAAPAAIRSAIETCYKESGELATVALLSSPKFTSDTLIVKGRSTASSLAPDTPATEKLFLLVLKEAVHRNASDIHIQPFVGGAAVRFRVDGVMQQLKSMPLAVMQRLIRHVKAIADLDVTNSRTPQDGRLTLITNEGQRDLRVSILPVEPGERLVIRLLSFGVSRAAELNFEEDQAALFRKGMRSSSGMVLVTGPTGSGKTTTLYSMLNLLNHDITNIMSVEDPVEIRMTGVSQSSVHPEQGLSFPSVLRSMLRQDPDVILVGEIRDTETAELALRASLTGHLVLSTLHTIDAVTTVPRLIDLGLSPILVADALLSVINQRLLRKLCPACNVRVDEKSANDLEALYLQLAKKRSVMHARACDACGHSGYKGRIPVSQVWGLTDDVRNLLRTGDADHDSLTGMAYKHGLRTLSESGCNRINDGITSVEETARILGPSFWSSLGSEEHSILEFMGKTERVSMHEKLLIVESDETLRSKLVTELELREYIVTAVPNSYDAALEIEKGEPLDLLLIDIENEHQSPMKSFSDLSSSLSMIGLSLVLLIPAGSEAVETLLETHGAADYLVKPISTERIADLVEAVLQRRHI